jgi:signal transduction histidine kinase
MEKEKSPDTEKYKRLVSAVQELSIAHDFDTVSKIVRNVSRELSGSDGATFILREGDLCYYVDENAMEPLWKGSRFPIKTCISGWVMENKTRAVIEDIYKDARIPHNLYRPTFVKSLVMVPIRTSNPIGAIGNYWAKPYTPSEDDLDLLQSLANITAVTLENIKTNEELERRVLERTQELEEVNKQLELFSYSVSHDLRAPLRSINGFMSILLEDHGKTMNEEAHKLAIKVLTNAGQMTTLINDLLSFFKTGKKQLQKKNIHMNSFVAEIANELRVAEKQRNISFTITDLPDAAGDEKLLRQVWLNLMSNAIKYTSKLQETKIEIGCEKKDNSNVYFISDNGAGFDMKYYNKLFGVFQRLHSQREFEGNGIGLAIVEKIITSHGGKIWAHSVPNEKTTFYFTLK